MSIFAKNYAHLKAAVESIGLSPEDIASNPNALQEAIEAKAQSLSAAESAAHLETIETLTADLSTAKASLSELHDTLQGHIDTQEAYATGLASAGIKLPALDDDATVEARSLAISASIAARVKVSAAEELAAQGHADLTAEDPATNPANPAPFVEKKPSFQSAVDAISAASSHLYKK